MKKSAKGRPSIYDRKLKPHLEDIKKAVSTGATVEEIAKAYDVAPSTIYKYKAEKKEFSDAFTYGREKVCIEIKATLLRRALGYNYEEKKQYIKKDENGKDTQYTEISTRYLPPSETAAGMLLRNYDKNWIDKDSITTSLKQQELELRKAIAKDNAFDLSLEPIENDK